MTSSIKTPIASAILATYNSQKSLVAAISSLLVQSVAIELIVVDDGSTDGSGSMVRVIEQSHPKKIKYFSQSHQGPAKARNLGAAHASAKILLFVDSDMTFDANYVRDLIAPIVANQVIGTYTTDERVANWDNVWARCWNIQECWADKLRFPSNPPKYGTDYRAILKSEFDKVGGFDDIGYTDTWSLFNKLGIRPLATSATCYHNNPSTLAAVYRQARWSAKRPYKYGLIGTIYALLRTSLPVSLVVGLIWSYKNVSYLIFKLVYDWGRTVGIIEMALTGKKSK